MNTQHPVVSLIMIFRDAERFLEAAVDSVIAQTLVNWELILVDDGSRDSGRAIARSKAAADERIRVLHHPLYENRGMSVSRNLGFRYASARLVGFPDADDVLAPTQLEEQVTILRENMAAEAVFGRTRYWFSWAEQSGEVTRDFVTDIAADFGSVIAPPSLLTRLWAPEGEFFCMCSLLMRRGLVARVGGFVEEFQSVNSDTAFHTKTFLTAPVFLADALWGSYRQHPWSSCATAIERGDKRDAWQRYVSWARCYLSEHGFPPSALDNALGEDPTSVGLPRPALRSPLPGDAVSGRLP